MVLLTMHEESRTILVRFVPQKEAVDAGQQCGEVVEGQIAGPVWYLEHNLGISFPQEGKVAGGGEMKIVAHRSAI